MVDLHFVGGVADAIDLARFEAGRLKITSRAGACA
jgi:hypothetical protein